MRYSLFEEKSRDEWREILDRYTASNVVLICCTEQRFTGYAKVSSMSYDELLCVFCRRGGGGSCIR